MHKCKYDLGRIFRSDLGQMAKRHEHGPDFASRVRRAQEIIMAQSGVDEFYEVLKLILVKGEMERRGVSGIPEYEACDRILSENKDQYADILDRNIALEYPPGLHSDLQALFNDCQLGSSDYHALDDAFEALTARNYKSDKGQYFTPRHVVDMIVEAMEPQAEQLICDPACGSGAFLKSAYSHIRRGSKAPTNLFGFDYSHRAAQVARATSLLGADNEIKIQQVDSLLMGQSRLFSNETKTIENSMDPNFEGFDLILTNPPFAGDVSAEEYANAYDIVSRTSRKIERDTLFIERCLRLLKVGGRMAMVLPDNKLTSKSFAGVRQWIAKNSKIRAVVSLHRYTFLPYTSQKASVLFAERSEPSNSIYDVEVGLFRSDQPGKSSAGDPIYKADADIAAPPYASLKHDLADIAEKVRAVL